MISTNQEICIPAADNGTEVADSSMHVHSLHASFPVKLPIHLPIVYFSGRLYKLSGQVFTNTQGDVTSLMVSL